MKQISQFLVCLAVWSAFGQVSAALTRSEQAQIESIQGTIKAGGLLYLQESYRDSAKKIRLAQMAYQKLSRNGDDEVMEALEPLKRRLVKARELLTKQGVKLPELKTFTKPPEEDEEEGNTEGAAAATIGELPRERMSEPGGEDRERMAAPRGYERERNPDTGELDSYRSESNDRELLTRRDTPDPSAAKTVSFVKQVAPILVGNCAGCHILESKGKFSMKSYTDLMQGGPEGPAINRNAPDKSSLISLVESGKMPPKGDRLSTEHVQLLKDWIQEGALFDGKLRFTELLTLLAKSTSAKDVQKGITEADLLRVRTAIDSAAEARETQARRLEEQEQARLQEAQNSRDSRGGEAMDRDGYGRPRELMDDGPPARNEAPVRDDAAGR